MNARAEQVRRIVTGDPTKIHTVRWRLVVVGFLVLAFSVAMAFAAEHKNAQHDAQRATTQSLDNDYRQCVSGNDSRKAIGDALLYVAERLYPPKDKRHKQAIDFVQDVIDKKLPQRDCKKVVFHPTEATKSAKVSQG